MRNFLSDNPWVVRAGRWLTKRRNILLAPLFTTALLGARFAPRVGWELIQDLSGVGFLWAGVWLRLVAASYHEGSHQSEPITAGPYGWIRHPLYVANFLIGLGVVLLAGWWPMIWFYLFFFIPLHSVIARSEEVHLTALYGEKYLQYRKQVFAFLPIRRISGKGYGSSSSFKLRKGQEHLKIVGYLAGALAIVASKRLWLWARVPFLKPLPHLVWFLGAAIVVLTVTLRPQIRSSTLRACQTVLSVVTVLFLVIHLPGVVPSRRPSPKGPAPQLLTLLPEEPRVISSPIFMTQKPVSKAPSRWTSFLENLDVLGGASAFGIVALVEGERDQGTFDDNVHHELTEVAQAALITAVVVSLWKQWHPAPEKLTHVSEPEPWRFQVGPALDEERKVAFVATWRRRF